MLLHGYGLNRAEWAFNTLCKNYPPDKAKNKAEEFKKAFDFLIEEGVTQVKNYYSVEVGCQQFEDRVVEEVSSRRKIKVPNLTLINQNDLIKMIFSEFRDQTNDLLDSE